MESATDPAAISERPLRPDLGARPLRLRNLRNLMLRENVDFVFVLGSAKSMRVGVRFGDGTQDAKTFNVGDNVGGGCFVLMHLSDNPEAVGVGWFDLSPAPTESK